VQNERQAVLLKDGYGRFSEIIMNPIDTKPLFPPGTDARTILWVGKSDERVKRPLMLLDLARRLPEFEFMIIMNFAQQDTHDECVRRAKELPNVTMLERVPYALIESYFANARLHLNTSLFEGFPNTFLQAAKYGVPTISLQVDPGFMLSRHGCGLVCAGDFSKLETGTRDLMNDRALRDQIGQRALDYVRAHHDKDVIIPRYEQVLSSVLDSGRR
jgi:glycosyltransferase involved in cell wall biosynthesis